MSLNFDETFNAFVRWVEEEEMYIQQAYAFHKEQVRMHASFGAACIHA